MKLVLVTEKVERLETTTDVSVHDGWTQDMATVVLKDPTQHGL